MTVAGVGKKVSVHYIGTLDNGRIFDSTPDDEPLVFTIGSDEIFPALEEAIIGMAPGETKNIFVPAEKAFGPRRKENVIAVERSLFPQDKPLTIGTKLNIEFSGGQARLMMVTAVSDTEVRLDGNHPLAGCDLTFALRLESVE